MVRLCYFRMFVGAMHTCRPHTAFVLIEEHPKCLFGCIADILHAIGLVNKKKETVEEVGLLVGGTTTQHFHADIPADESNEEDYKVTMSHVYAPASILLGFGNPVRLVVEEKDISDTFIEGGETKCRIDGGYEGESIKMIGMSNGGVMLEHDRGFIFQGDFWHAGAPMRMSQLDVGVWKQVENLLMPAVIGNIELNDKEKKDIFHEFCDVRNFHLITRLHVAVKPKDIEFTIQPNSVQTHRDDDDDDDDEDDDEDDDDDSNGDLAAATKKQKRDGTTVEQKVINEDSGSGED
jgi:hypothetical protein